MKTTFKTIALLALATAFVACNNKDEMLNTLWRNVSQQQVELEDQAARIAAYEDLSAQTNTNVAALGGTIAGKQNIMGRLPGLFSVAAGKQVRFSQGNLQYQARTNTWRFAEHQYDIIGDGNSNISDTYSGWIDLFGWGTSGWDSGANAYQPYATSGTVGDYHPGNSASNNLAGTFANADWGVHNAISNGGNMTGLWRTLTKTEWVYLLQTRTNATSLYGQATVGDVKGLIICPDNFKTPYGLTFTTGTGNYDRNVYTITEWQVIEAAGAVFLPAAGSRDEITMRAIDLEGFYWSSTNAGTSSAERLYFADNTMYIGMVARSYGFSVRLVTEL